MPDIPVKSAACGSVLLSALLLGSIHGALASSGGSRAADVALPLTTPSLPLATPTIPVPTLPPLSIATPSLTPLPTLLPTSLPVPLTAPSILPTVTPSLPSLIGGSTPTPVPSRAPGPPGAYPSPSPSASVDARTVAFNTGHDGAGTGAGGGSKGALAPLLGIAGGLPGSVGLALLVGLAVLPMLVLVFLLASNRLLQEAWAMRGGRLRMALASELDLRPRELAALSPDGLLKLRDQVTFDELTGALRRVAGIAAAEREIARARRSRSPLVAAFVDVDGLKRVNDSGGHSAGDALLKGVAAILQAGLRKQDLVFRYGGDEFVCLLSGVGAEEADQRLRALQAEAGEKSRPFSYGLSELRDRDDVVSFLGRADQELYSSKAKRAQEIGAPVTVLPVGLDRPSAHR